jgi:transcriptional regulator with XRE-family HTH domain
MDTDARIKRLRAALGWQQWAMAEFLGLSQPSVANIERGQPESGPVSRLLHMLEAAIARGLAKPGMTPVECLQAIAGEDGEADDEDWGGQ